jgi:hypothetical protein
MAAITVQLLHMENNVGFDQEVEALLVLIIDMSVNSP